MKSFYTLSLLTTALLFSLTSAQATNQLISENTAPGLPETSEDCFDMLEVNYHKNLKKLCHSLDKCEKQESQNTGELTACVEHAQGMYELRMNPKMKAEGEIYQGETFPVNTVESGADVNIKGPDHKGFKNSIQ